MKGMAISYHAGIEDGEELKKDILETSRMVFRMSEVTEDMKTLRVEKITTIIKLNKVGDDMLKLLKALRELLPRAQSESAQQEVELVDIERELQALEQQVSQVLG